MDRQRNQHTVAKACQLTGRGYWTGRLVTLRFCPARVGTGVQFVRADLPGRPVIRASVGARREADLRTVLAAGDAEVAMVEHLMAGLYALEIDNCIVELDGPEVPGFDGSCEPIVAALRPAGLLMQAAGRRQVIVDRTVRVGSAGNWVEASPATDGRLTVEYRLDYGPSCPIPPQTFAVPVSPESFCRELAPARTFVTADQAVRLRAQGLAPHVTERDLLVFGNSGPIGGALRMPEECARHKALDIVGDLALVGADIVGRIVSFRGGHRLNGAMAHQLCKMASEASFCRRAA